MNARQIAKSVRNRPALDEWATGHRDFVHLHGVAVCAGSTTEYGQVEGGCAKSRKHYRQRQAYCQINNVGGQMVEAAQEKDSKKAEALFERVDDLEKQLGPQYRAVFDALYDADPNSKDVQDILSMFDTLDESCPH